MISIKKVLVILLSLIMILCVGCNKDSKTSSNYTASPNKATPYTSETAIKNGDVVRDIAGKQYNVEKLETFIENVKRGTKDKIRITSYTDEGEPALTDLEFDGKMINYSKDNSRVVIKDVIKDVNKAATKAATKDNDVIQSIQSIESNTYKSIYKKNSGYYLKNSDDDICIY